eukprot:scaffold45662_cov226-Skeletonema_marinoi.AAC.2
MSTGLSRNSRLNAVLSPCIVDESSRQEDGTIQIKPNTQTRFFTDDTQHGLCIVLGLAELLGFDLERDMPQALYVVRRLQKWMKKEFVLPQEKVTAGSKIVSDAKDVSETSAPQAFGVKSVQELKRGCSKEQWINGKALRQVVTFIFTFEIHPASCTDESESRL